MLLLAWKEIWVVSDQTKLEVATRAVFLLIMKETPIELALVVLMGIEKKHLLLNEF